MAENALPLFANAGRFYVYIYRDPRPSRRRRPIYVGKGMAARERADSHWSKGTHNPILARLFRKFQKMNLTPTIELVGWFDDERAAFALEIALIRKIGRLDLKTGPLCNLTEGGEGVRIGAAGKAKIGAATKRFWADPEARARLLSVRKAAITPEFRARLSAIRKAAYDQSPEARALMSAARAKALADPEVRARKSAATKARWADPLERARLLASRRAALADPLVRARMSATMKEVMRMRKLARNNGDVYRGEQQYIAQPIEQRP